MIDTSSETTDHLPPLSLTEERKSWKALWRRYVAYSKLNNDFRRPLHPETDGSTERANQAGLGDTYVTSLTTHNLTGRNCLPMAKACDKQSGRGFYRVKPLLLGLRIPCRLTGTGNSVATLHREVESARNPRETAVATIAKLSRGLVVRPGARWQPLKKPKNGWQTRTKRPFNGIQGWR